MRNGHLWSPWIPCRCVGPVALSELARNWERGFRGLTPLPVEKRAAGMTMPRAEQSPSRERWDPRQGTSIAGGPAADAAGSDTRPGGSHPPEPHPGRKRAAWKATSPSAATLLSDVAVPAARGVTILAALRGVPPRLRTTRAPGRGWGARGWGARFPLGTYFCYPPSFFVVSPAFGVSLSSGPANAFAMSLNAASRSLASPMRVAM
jgi:hypothetical protein